MYAPLHLGFGGQRPWNCRADARSTKMVAQGMWKSEALCDMSRWQARKCWRARAKTKLVITSTLGDSLQQVESIESHRLKGGHDDIFVPNWAAFLDYTAHEATTQTLLQDHHAVPLQLLLEGSMDRLRRALEQARWETKAVTEHGVANCGAACDLEQLSRTMQKWVRHLEQQVDALPSRCVFQVTFCEVFYVEADTGGLTQHHAWGPGVWGGLVLPRTKESGKYSGMRKILHT